MAIEILEEKYWGTLKKKLLEGMYKNYTGKQVKEEHKQIASILLENMRLTESVTTSQNQNVIVPLILGLTKRFLPKLIANEIVSVQPMNRPTSMVKFKKMYFEDFEIGGGTNDGLYPSGDLSKGHPSYTRAYTETITSLSVNAGAEVSVPLSNVKQPFETLAKGSVFITLNGVTKYEINGVIDFGPIVFKVSKTGVSVKNNGSTNETLTFVIGYNILGFETNVPDAIARVSYDIENIPVYAQTRKLKASWTYEFMEDITAELGDMINIENEIFEDVSSLIAQEINREILDDLIAGQESVGHVTQWEYKAPTQTTMLTQEAYYRTLLHTINEVGQKITKATRRFEPNFIVVSPRVREILTNGLTQYEFKPVNEQYDYGQVGFVYSGTISGRYNLYVTPSVPDNKVIVGYKGQSILDSGYVFAPYIPLKGVPVTYESVPGVMFYTRNGKQMYAPWYYGVVNIQGL